MRDRGFPLEALTALALSMLLVCSAIQPSTAGPPSGEGKILFSGDTFPVPAGADEVGGWTTWSQRAETAPDFFTSEIPNLGGPGSLTIYGASNNSSHGCWVRVVDGIEPGKFYRFEASFRAHAVPFPRQQVLSRLDWLGPDGARVHQPEYVPEQPAPEGEWRKNSGVFQAPEGAAGVKIELYLSYCPQGTVWWDRVSLAEVPDPGERKVRVGTVHFQPGRKFETGGESVDSYLPWVRKAGEAGCDIVCLGEGMNLAGVIGGAYDDIAEPVPGPTTEKLGRIAREYGMYVVGCLGERDGHAIYNTAVLIDRQGRIAGKYRKVYLPREEIEAGVTPGDAYPVFDTDFGRIGMMICWDGQYIDPARALAVQGAEIIFWPVWGGNEILARARCIENQLYLVSASYSSDILPTAIIGHWGDYIATATGSPVEEPKLIRADLDLNEKFPDQWLGDMRLRFLRERRADVKVPALER